MNYNTHNREINPINIQLKDAIMLAAQSVGSAALRQNRGGAGMAEPSSSPREVVWQIHPPRNQNTANITETSRTDTRATHGSRGTKPHRPSVVWRVRHGEPRKGGACGDQTTQGPRKWGPALAETAETGIQIED